MIVFDIQVILKVGGGVLRYLGSREDLDSCFDDIWKLGWNSAMSRLPKVDIWNGEIPGMQLGAWATSQQIPLIHRTYISRICMQLSGSAADLISRQGRTRPTFNPTQPSKETIKSAHLQYPGMGWIKRAI